MKGQNIRTVELQLLRHGPPHNQLLSPLTDYLALCGDHPNTTLNFPLEHQSLKVRLHALRYKDSEDTRKIQLFETASVVGQMFADVPGLISELGHRDSAAEALVHLSIATTASELSLVPFELANSPPGFPGSGGSLSLQTEFPVCITRRSRKVRFDSLNWNVPPRILMVSSDAGGDVPLTAHYALLRKLIDPWVLRDALAQAVDEDTLSEDEVLANVRERLVLLKDASVRGVRDEIHKAIDENRPYTHIHVLAHGCPLPNQDDSYGVAMHDSGGKGIDAVDGIRLGQLFSGKLVDDHPIRRANSDTIRPNVVTLAICDSGNTGFDVARPGASVAFHIHEAGIPMVVGSQFQLTMGGSIVLTNSIYRQLLEGCDPRICLWEARRDLLSQNAERLKVGSEGRHDWASIVAFAAFPPDIERESRKLESEQAQLRMDLKLRASDPLVEHVQHCIGSKDLETSLTERIENHAEQVKEEVHAFDRFVDQNARNLEDTRLLGVSASANKRAAEILWIDQKLQASQKKNQDADKADAHSKAAAASDDWLDCVWQSQKRYLLVSEKDANQAWAFVQSLFLTRFLTFYRDPFAAAEDAASDKKKSKSTREKSENSRPDRMIYQDWFRAHYLTSLPEHAECVDPTAQVWTLSNKVELGLLMLLIPQFLKSTPKGLRGKLRKRYGLDKIIDWLGEMDRFYVTADNDAKFAVYAGRRQILRYRRFADMMCVRQPSADQHQTKRMSLAENGYELLVAEYPEFGETYREIEQHVNNQIEIEPEG